MDSIIYHLFIFYRINLFFIKKISQLIYSILIYSIQSIWLFIINMWLFIINFDLIEDLSWKVFNINIITFTTWVYDY